MAFFWIAEYRGVASFMQNQTLTTRGMRLFLKEGMTQAGLHWHENVLPKHFRKNARTVYGYQKRKKPYSRIKRLLAQGQEVYVRGEKIEDKVLQGGVVDILRSGKTQSKTRNKPRINAGPRTATVRVRVPGYISRRKRTQPNMRYELTRINDQDRLGMQMAYQNAFIANVKKYGHLFVKKKIGR